MRSEVRRGDHTSLATLLHDRRSDDQPVAFDGGTSRTWGSFTGDVRGLCARLQQSPAERWLLVSDDAYAFAVALFAVAHSGGVAVLPPNAQAGTLARLAGFVDGFLVDDATALPATAAGDVVAPLGHRAQAAIELATLDPDAAFVEFLTSGTTGESKRVPKRLRHLDHELAVLEEVFGDVVGTARVFATVSHQHIYGALFRVLWPLACGRPFSSRTFLHGVEAVAQMTGDPAVLVSSPVQLRAMADAGVLRGARPVAIYSSGALLDGRTAGAVAETAGVPVTEVLGSTETGGVAWRRCPRGDEQPWQPLPGVRLCVDANGNLAVSSPFVSIGEPEAPGMYRFVMGDRGAIDACGTFALHGRADRIVKIGGKRLSLPEMENEISRGPLAEEAALVVSQRGLELRVCAAVVLSAAGRVRLNEIGRAELGRELAAALAPFFDRVLLPRAWRFVEQLPRNPQGKLTAAALQELFAGDAAPERDQGSGHDVAIPHDLGGPVVAPVLLAERRTENELVRDCTVPPDLAFFAGHFDDMPVVAGVVHLLWVVAAIESLLGTAPRVIGVEALKFKRPLLPGENFTLAVTLDGARHSARFRLSRADEEISSGRVQFG